jgi:hypothetical protein
MGVRTRGLDIKAGAAKLKADRAARIEAELVIDRWNRRLATGRDMLWSPTIRAALIAGTPWLDVFCPGCGTSRAIDLRTVDRHPLASVGLWQPRSNDWCLRQASGSGGRKAEAGKISCYLGPSPSVPRSLDGGKPRQRCRSLPSAVTLLRLWARARESRFRLQS